MGFAKIVETMQTFKPRSEIVLEEVPAPQKLAEFSFAFSADVSNGLLGDAEDEVASGRFVLLHEPGGQETWDGDFRCVTFIRADVDLMMQEDPLLPSVGWNWFLSNLETVGCHYTAASGTVTRVASASFGKLSPRADEAEMEIRASWTPILSLSKKSGCDEMLLHIQAWCTLLAELAGLAPIPEGITSITARGSR